MPAQNKSREAPEEHGTHRRQNRNSIWPATNPTKSLRSYTGLLVLARRARSESDRRTLQHHQASPTKETTDWGKRNPGSAQAWTPRSPFLFPSLVGSAPGLRRGWWLYGCPLWVRYWDPQLRWSFLGLVIDSGCRYVGLDPSSWLSCRWWVLLSMWWSITMCVINYMALWPHSNVIVSLLRSSINVFLVQVNFALKWSWMDDKKSTKVHKYMFLKLKMEWFKKCN